MLVGTNRARSLRPVTRLLFAMVNGGEADDNECDIVRGGAGLDPVNIPTPQHNAQQRTP